METLFAFDQRNYRDCQNSYRGTHNREYYLGDYSIDPAAVIDVRADRRAVGASSIIRLVSRTRLSFRRSWSHIQEDFADVAVLCFVRRGIVTVSQACGESVAKAGDFIVTKSVTPFTIDSRPGEDGAFEILHLNVPTTMLRRFGCHDINCGFSVAAKGRGFAMAERILSELFEDAGEFNEAVTQQLLDSALALICEAIKNSGRGLPQRQTLAERRLQDVLRFIETHLSDPKLSVAGAARGCGISPRYLSLLLKQSGTPFSSLIWEKRLQTAGQWLAAARSRDASISEVAYRVGFKSPAHFSRMFKQEFKLTPRQYRDHNMAAERTEPAPLLVYGGESRH